jgi:putative PIN family toxin of toxin-antitoxin system
MQQQRAVVDTNVWLDLYFFRDPGSQSVARALESPHWVAARCEQTDAELQAVLQRPRFSSDPAAQWRLHEQLRRWGARAPLFRLGAPAPCKCRDPEDQKFLDLAFATAATVLLTKDKALLALNCKARGHGLRVLTPREFARQFPQYGTTQSERVIQGMVAP